MNYYDAMQIRLRHAQNLPVSHAALTEANSYIERERKLQREQRMHAPPAPPPRPPEVRRPPAPPESQLPQAEDPTFGTPLMCVGWAVVADAGLEAMRIATEARAAIALALTPIIAIDFYRSAV